MQSRDSPDIWLLHLREHLGLIHWGGRHHSTLAKRVFFKEIVHAKLNEASKPNVPPHCHRWNNIQAWRLPLWLLSLISQQLQDTFAHQPQTYSI